MSMPRPHYQSYGKRGHPHGPSARGHPIPSHAHVQRMSSMPPPQHVPVEVVTPASTYEEPVPYPCTNHEQVVRFVRDAWAKAKKDLTDPPEDPACQITYYEEAGPNPLLKDFVPFDLEELRKRRKETTAPPQSSS